MRVSEWLGVTQGEVLMPERKHIGLCIVLLRGQHFKLVLLFRNTRRCKAFAHRTHYPDQAS